MGRYTKEYIAGEAIEVGDALARGAGGLVVVAAKPETPLLGIALNDASQGELVGCVREGHARVKFWRPGYEIVDGEDTLEVPSIVKGGVIVGLGGAAFPVTEIPDWTADADGDIVFIGYALESFEKALYDHSDAEAEPPYAEGDTIPVSDDDKFILLPCEINVQYIPARV